MFQFFKLLSALLIFFYFWIDPINKSLVTQVKAAMLKSIFPAKWQYFISITTLILFVDSETCSTSGGMFFNNHCYWVSTEKVDSIVEARDKCQKRNARLASIETAVELTFLSAHLEGGESTKWLTSGREIGNSSPRQWARSLDPTWQQPIKYQQETQWQPGPAR